MVKAKLHIDTLCTSYGKRQILQSFTTTPLTSGKVIGLLGPNACGKSTLLKTIAGVHKPQSGTVTLHVDGEEISPKSRPLHLGYMPQDLPAAVSLTTFETIMVSASRKSSAQTAQRLTAEIMCELGIAHLSHRYLGELSGGQRQMVAFAQMAVADPPLILLDEPTSALDLNKQVFLLRKVHQRVRETGAIALIAIHDINLAAKFCDELLVMKDGILKAQGKPQELLTSDLLQEVFDVEAKVLYHEETPVVATLG